MRFNKKLMGIVQREIERINGLVTEFLWMAKGSPKSAQVEDVAVCSVIEEIIALLKAKKQVTHLIRSGRISRPGHRSQSIPTISTGCSGTFWSTLWKRCRRGESFRSRSTSRSRPTIRAEPVRIDIGDTGCGIPGRRIQKNFRPLFHHQDKWNGSWVEHSLSTGGESRWQHRGKQAPVGDRNNLFAFFPTESVFFTCQMKLR